jgi:hypothetical protein
MEVRYENDMLIGKEKLGLPLGETKPVFWQMVPLQEQPLRWVSTIHALDCANLLSVGTPEATDSRVLG